MTEWRDIHGCEGRYRVSDDGRVMTFPDAWGVYQDGSVKPHCRVRPFTLAPSRTKNGYHQVRLSAGDGTIKTWQVHRLVALDDKNRPHPRDEDGGGVVGTISFKRYGSGVVVSAR